MLSGSSLNGAWRRGIPRFSWNRETWDLSAMDALEDNSLITFSLGNSYTATAFDEIIITGTPIPEPSRAFLALLGFYSALIRRRRYLS